MTIFEKKAIGGLKWFVRIVIGFMALPIVAVGVPCAIFSLVSITGLGPLVGFDLQDLQPFLANLSWFMEPFMAAWRLLFPKIMVAILPAISLFMFYTSMRK